MTINLGSQITDLHKRALHALVFSSGEEWESCFADVLKQDSTSEGYAALLAFSLGTAVRRRFSDSWSRADVVRFVADLRISLNEPANEFNPRLAEAIIRFLLGDSSLKENPFNPENREDVGYIESILLVTLVSQIGLDEDDLSDLINEAAENAKEVDWSSPALQAAARSQQQAGSPRDHEHDV